MRIQTITVDNFKSLVDFRIDLAKFNCLIGLNGSGKSTVLQFMDFLAQQVRGDITSWLKERSWGFNEIGSRLTAKKSIDFNVTLVSSKGDADVSWTASFTPTLSLCSFERIETRDATLEVKDGHYHISKSNESGNGSQGESHKEISFYYEGSILSRMREELLPPSLIHFKNYFKRVKSLDLLSPEYLRQRTREDADSLGLGGQNLPAFLWELCKKGKLEELEGHLRRAYPQLDTVRPRELASGVKRLEITESYRSTESTASSLKVTTEAQHINDGMLRLIAMLAELQTDDRFVLFDEIENGINPELVEFVLDALISADQQVLVTTHSPMILNYLEDDVAKEGVHYLYKTPEGCTQAIPFFSIPSLEKKLSVMGPGEAFVDTDLIALGDEIAAMPGG